MKHHNVSDLGKHSSRSDQRGDGTAKIRELERVKRVREKQLRAAQKNLKDVEEKAMQETTETTSEKTRSYTQKKLAPVELEAIERLVSTQGEQRVVSWLSGTPRAQLAQHPMSWARGALRSIRDPEAAHKSTLLDVAAELLTNFGKHHNGQRVEATPIPVEVTEVRSVVESRATPVTDGPIQAPVNDPDSGVFEAPESTSTVDAQPRPPSSEETGIVRRVESDGITVPWILPSLTREGAEQARVSLTDAASLLGYSDKDALRQLANRHSQEIAEFGVTFTVKVTGKVGVATRTWDEPTYNPDQFILLGMLSQTEQGKKIRVWLLKSFSKLLAGFEQATREPLAQQSRIDRDVLAVMNSQARTIGDFVARDLLREQNEAERLKAQSGWAERKPKPKTENPDQVNFVVEQEASEIHGKAQKVTGLRQKRCTTELDRDTAASGVYRELRTELAKLGHSVPSESDEKQNHYIARNGWTTEACAILAVIYDREKKLAADLKRSIGQRT